MSRGLGDVYKRQHVNWEEGNQNYQSTQTLRWQHCCPYQTNALEHYTNTAQLKSIRPPFVLGTMTTSILDVLIWKNRGKFFAVEHINERSATNEWLRNNAYGNTKSPRNLWIIQVSETERGPAAERSYRFNTQGRELALEIRNTSTKQRPELPRLTLNWHECKYKVHKLHVPCTLFMCLVFFHSMMDSWIDFAAYQILQLIMLHIVLRNLFKMLQAIK